MPIREEQIKEWKDKHGKIYQVSIGGKRFVYRQLNVRECERVQNYLVVGNTDEVDDFLVKSCLLYPSDFDIENQPAGDIALIGKSIMSSAGFFNEQSFSKILEESDRIASSMFETDFFQWKIIITQTLPGYKLSDLGKLSPLDFFVLVRICEKLRGEAFITENNAPGAPDGSDKTDSSPTRRRGKSNFLSREDMKAVADDSTRKLPAQRIIEEYEKLKGNED